jgi:D-inositol-3-phosphate glycosyltransferase
MSRFQEWLGGLRWRLTGLRRLFRPGAQPQEMFLPPIRIPDPTEAVIDHPGAGYIYEDDTLSFVGWVAYADGSPVARVEAWLDETPVGRARVSVPRPDVEKRKDIPLARISGFDFSTELGLLPAAVREGARELRIVTTSAAGERIEIDPLPVLLQPRKWITEPPPAPPAPLTRPAPTSALRVLVFTHQLTLGGAQLYLLDLLRQLHDDHDVELTVVSGIDGPVRRDLEEIGIAVHLTAMAAFEKPGNHLGRVGELTSWLREGDFDVAFVNTATSGASFGAEVARQLDIPAVWAIHESFPPSILWADLRKKVREYTEGALSGAHCAIFEADATRQILGPLIGDGRCVTIPYGVDVRPIEQARAKLDKAATRRCLGVPVGAELAVCVGTVEPRKAQVPLAQAFSLIAAEHPRARLAFVGAREDDPHTEELEKVIEESPFADRVDVIEITPDVQDWYGVADVLVCASDVESLPRTVLEAMLWETPVLATAVFGIPDVVKDGVSGWLCEPRDLQALAKGLDRAFSAGVEERQRIGAAARELVQNRHSLPGYAVRVHEILTAAIDTPKQKEEGRH